VSKPNLVLMEISSSGVMGKKIVLKLILAGVLKKLTV